MERRIRRSQSDLLSVGEPFQISALRPAQKHFMQLYPDIIPRGAPAEAPHQYAVPKPRVVSSTDAIRVLQPRPEIKGRGPGELNIDQPYVPEAYQPVRGKFHPATAYVLRKIFRFLP
jgi:hypothetical protein